MTLIEGIGDEVTHFFIALFVIIIVSLAWWTTNISEQRHVRTVLLLERRRLRAHRRLTNHTETVTITEGSPILSPITEQPLNATTELADPEPSTSVLKPSGANNPEEPRPQVQDLCPEEEENIDEEQNIIETMDADASVLRQRRLAFYENYNTGNNDPPNSTQPAELPQTSSTTVDSKVHEGAHCSQETDNISSKDKAGITIKLKYINDDLKVVDGKLDELLGDFKKRHFQLEISSDKLVRLIFNGQVLQPDTQTLQSCGLFDNCVVHCLIHQKRAPQNDPLVMESRREGYSFPNQNSVPNFNNNNQNREWDLGNFLFAFISFILLAAWYFRYVYAHLYTVTATVGLILITGIFTIVLVGMYFPDNENLPNPTIRIARERVPPQQ